MKDIPFIDLVEHPIVDKQLHDQVVIYDMPTVIQMKQGITLTIKGHFTSYIFLS
jgi:hypothetical protein